MKGLASIPQQADFARAYEVLQARARDVTASELVLWSQWSRFDPRLAEQLVGYLSQAWRQLSPLEIHDELSSQPWPAALGVLLEQAIDMSDEPSLMRAWAALVLQGVDRASGELFFIGLRGIGGRVAFDDALYAIPAYRKWGYLGREILRNKAPPTDRTLLTPASRRVALDHLIAERERLTVNDYITALDGRVSRRQAELDLRADRRLSPRGRTRGRFYVVNQ